MNRLNKIADQLIADNPEGEIVVSSGVSPSGTYHLGTLREVLTAEAIYRELISRGRESRHIHVVDDLDIFRKVPADVDESFSQYLGMPLCDVPSPDKSKGETYADFFLSDLIIAAKDLHLDMEILRSHEKYRSGFFADAIEKTLANIPSVRSALEDVSGRKLDPNWSPVQVLEKGRLKNRQFVSIDVGSKNIVYLNAEGKEVILSYESGDVKLNWRIDWPARWWKLKVQAEPFGRDHATKGGSYDTGAVIVESVFNSKPPLPVPYDFINRTGDTKKMSKSAGDTITASDLLKILPAELVWYFILRYSPDKLLFFDTGDTLIRLFDEFSELLAKKDKSEQEDQLLKLCLKGIDRPTVSRVPFTHLYVSYQASLRNIEKTLEVIARTEYAQAAVEERLILEKELAFIDEWLNNWADDEVTFSITDSVDESLFTESQKKYLSLLAETISNVPEDAGGEWFHKSVYDLKDKVDLEPKQLFTTLYQVLIAKDSGPRAGWFLSALDHDWLIKRLLFKL